MREAARHSLALRIAVGALPLLSFDCGRSIPVPRPDAASASRTGGDVAATGGAMGTGGTLGTGGDGERTGGVLGTGGSSSATARASTGGTTPGAGGGIGTGAVVATGGSFIGHGGRSGTGGIGVVPGTGGATAPPASSPIFVGNTDTKGIVRPDFAAHWDQLTPEIAGKWEAVQTAADTFNWSVIDALYKYAEDNSIIFKEHSFIQGMTSEPTWTSRLTPDAAPAAVQGWMKAFCARYPKTRLIDVVTEPPPHMPAPKYADAIGGGTKTTWDWIANAFKWAREACPDAILILNDYNNIEYPADSQNTIDIANAIQKLDAPIDAIGCEAHDAVRLPASTLKARIDLIASSTGLPVYITEYDIGLADDEEQKLLYQDHFTMFMSNPNVKGVTVWGYIVGETWRLNTGIMTSEGAMRPAMAWLMDFLGR